MKLSLGMFVVVLLGAPGAGKGTQAPLLSKRLGIPVVATGDLFRAAVRDGTPLGMEARRYMDAGQLVPDDIVQMITASGEPDEVREKVGEYVANGCTCPILYPLGDDVRLMIDTFAGGL